MSMVQSVDSVALLPAYLAAGTAVLVLLVDLLLARPAATVATAAAGAVATVVGAAAVGAGGVRRTFCVGTDCSYVFGGRAALVAALVAVLVLGVLALSGPLLRAGATPVGEFCFLLACSMAGGVVLGAAGDLITLIVAVETLTLPLYILVGLRRGSLASAEAAVTFFVVSVIATTVTLLGAALLYATTGALHLERLGVALADGSELLDLPLTGVAVTLVVAGLAFKVAAVPFHAWAPATYDGAPLPVAAYLSTASKLGGVVALLAVVQFALPQGVTGPVLALVAVLTMTVGNLVALRQRRTVRLLAWSSVAQAGYILAPLGALALADADARSGAYAAALAYAVFFVLLELAAFAGVVALRPAGADGGRLDDLRGAARRHPWVGAALAFALVGLAGLPPALAGLFAKVTVVRALLAGDAGWLALVVAVNAVIGLAYYLRFAALLYAPTGAVPAVPAGQAVPAVPAVPAGQAAAGAASTGDAVTAAVRPARVVTLALAVATVLAVIVGFAPQLVLDLTGN
ncbi:NADH-quinone oxidoreductase subunit N [Micromonospora endophytica]|uniref:NADH-quinone oxidoreductase subunit N n=1 Tax=Micromonospora endophytica TaxID=515350 RepID=A0A2W2C3H1_9ACTN|nr:proton-conducting transporter membrane subunit [Micromonospora endophytica]PZF87264.1 NADH-quinone oxidoreductase subunit N [Micromonospora endophytica]RIW43139.1 NADH-quinone oxidoreductase subunit N [Micromonospora endophytica]